MPDQSITASGGRFTKAVVELLVIFACGVFIYGWKLGDAPLDRTEPHRALVAHQMVTSGQWFIPKLFGEVYLRKPPLIYWIEAGTEKLIGHGDEFVWRLPSAAGSAALAVILAAWSARWFGAFARLPAGIACLALVPLWEQDRGADIDALNTVASVVTAMVVLELLYPNGRGELEAGERPSFNARRSTCSEGHHLPLNLARRALNIERLPHFFLCCIALPFALAATLLLKGPGGLPPILGAILGPSILLRDWRWVRRPGIWIGFVIGIAIFASYGIIAKSVLHHQGIVTDTGGVREAMQRLVIHKLTAVVPAILAPVTTLLYAVPISLVPAFLLVSFRRSNKPAGRFPVVLAMEVASPPEPVSTVRPEWKRESKRRVLALVATIAAAFVVWIVAGNDNPRYEYVALPLLAPMAGAVAVAWRAGLFSATLSRVLRSVLGVFSGLWAGLAIVITVMIWTRADDHTGLAIAAGISLIAGALGVICWFSGGYRVAATAWIVVIFCLAVPLGERKNLERRKKSARAAAEQLRQIVHGQPIGIVSMNRDMPELFYYAGLPVTAYGERGLDKLARVPGGHWVVLSQNRIFPEYGSLTTQIPTAFPNGVTRLTMPDPRDVVYVGWYDPPAGVSRAIKPTPVSAAADSSDAD